jgi:threonyl-tRNA synthetase
MIHRVVLAGIERFFGVLIEHYAGEFPLWLAPVQAVIVPVADRHLPYAQEVEGVLSQGGLRVEIDDDRQTVNMKIRRAQLQKVPFSLVVGDKDVEAHAVSVRDRGGREERGVPLEKFLTVARAMVEKRSPNSAWGR